MEHWLNIQSCRPFTIQTIHKRRSFFYLDIRILLAWIFPFQSVSHNDFHSQYLTTFISAIASRSKDPSTLNTLYRLCKWQLTVLSRHENNEMFYQFYQSFLFVPVRSSHQLFPADKWADPCNLSAWSLQICLHSNYWLSLVILVILVILSPSNQNKSKITNQESKFKLSYLR